MDSPSTTFNICKSFSLSSVNDVTTVTRTFGLVPWNMATASLELIHSDQVPLILVSQLIRDTSRFLQNWLKYFNCVPISSFFGFYCSNTFCKFILEFEWFRISSSYVKRYIIIIKRFFTSMILPSTISYFRIGFRICFRKRFVIYAWPFPSLKFIMVFPTPSNDFIVFW